MADKDQPTSPAPAPQEPVRNPEGFWNPYTEEKNEEAGLTVDKKDK